MGDGKTVIIEADDWMVIYFNGKAIYQNHDISLNGLIALSNGYKFVINDIEFYEVKEKDDEELYNSGYFPEYIGELKESYTIACNP